MLALAPRHTIAVLAVVIMASTIRCGPPGPAAEPSAPSVAEQATVDGSATQSPSNSTQAGSSVGNFAPEFELLLEDGTSVTLARLREESQPTFLFFFTTW